MSLPSLPKPSIAAAALPPEPDPDPDPPPRKSSSSSSNFLWSSLFADPIAPISPSSDPSYLPDGTPIVLAPPSVILKASSSWAGHLLCRFLGEPPSPAKFYNDLNKIWGKHGDISVRRFSSGTFLVFVPSAGTRKWILQTGLWSSGTVSFVVSEWSVNGSLAAPPKLTSATTILTIREIPPQLWSQEAVATIAGGVAKLIPDTRAVLSRTSLGTATIRAIVPLGSPLPPLVLVKDANGDSVLVSVDYGNLPHLCPNCNSYGHKSHRCPKKHIVSNATEVGNNTESTSHKVPGIEMDVDVDSPVSTDIEVPDTQKNKKDDSAGVVTSITDVQPSSSDKAFPMHSNSPLPDSKNPEVNSLSAPLVAGSAMEVDVSSAKVFTSPQPTVIAPTVQLPPQDSSQSGTPEADQEVQTNVEPSSLVLQSPQVPISNIPLSNVMPCESSSVQEDKPIQSPSDAVQTEFTYPPPSSCAISHFIDPSLSPQTSTDCAPAQHQTDAKVSAKRGRNRDRESLKFDSKAALRCNSDTHQFKPRGIIEKRRKKLNDERVPTDAEVQECILQMQSDQVNTLHYQTIEAYKILRDIESSNHEAGKT